MILSNADSQNWTPTKIMNRSSELFAWCRKPQKEGYKVEVSPGSRDWFVVMKGRYDLIASSRAMMYLKAFFFETIVMAISRQMALRCIGNHRRMKLMTRSVTICVSCTFFSSSSFLGCRSWWNGSDLHHHQEGMIGRLNDLLCYLFLVVYYSRCRILHVMSCFTSD